MYPPIPILYGVYPFIGTSPFYRYPILRLWHTSERSNRSGKYRKSIF
nr:MAG TPA: hypothetical protein [Caudoviricetes sp.]